MRNMGRWLIGIVVLAAFGFATWALVSNNAEAQIGPDEEPVHVEHIENSNLSRIILSEKAVQRLDIKTLPIEIGDGARKVVPYSALLYDADGNTWIYINLEERVFVRAKITVDYIDSDQAVLSEGPDSGTNVVSTGAAELYGAEVGVGH